MDNHPHIYVPKNLENDAEIIEFTENLNREKRKIGLDEKNKADVVYLSVMTGVDL